MATEHTATEIVQRSELAHDAARFITYGALRHVAFVVLEKLLHESAAPQITVTLTLRREDHLDGHRAFTARGHLDAAHA
jgi:hypothetical protein